MSLQVNRVNDEFLLFPSVANADNIALALYACDNTNTTCKAAEGHTTRNVWLRCERNTITHLEGLEIPSQWDFSFLPMLKT